MTAREFTTRWIESVKVGSRTDFIDPYTPGLMLRVSASGVKSWALLYRRQSDQRRRRVTLGRFPRMGLKEARVTAAGHFKAIGSGADPAGEAIALRKVETVSELLDRLGDHRFVAVIGTSGTGKSSLVRAGLRPALDRGYLIDTSSRWRVVTIRPGHTPLRALSVALASVFPLPSGK